MCTEHSTTAVTRQLLHHSNSLNPSHPDSRIGSRDSMKQNGSVRDMLYLQQQQQQQQEEHRHACFEQQDNRLFVIELFLHAADVSNPAKVTNTLYRNSIEYTNIQVYSDLVEHRQLLQQSEC
jgi:hypothetical protein